MRFYVLQLSFLAAVLFYIPSILTEEWSGWYSVINAGLGLLFSHNYILDAK